MPICFVNVKDKEHNDFLRLLDEEREQIKNTCYIAGLVSSLVSLSFYFALVSLSETTKYPKLIIFNINGVDKIFTWNL